MYLKSRHNDPIRLMSAGRAFRQILREMSSDKSQWVTEAPNCCLQSRLRCRDRCAVSARAHASLLIQRRARQVTLLDAETPGAMPVPAGRDGSRHEANASRVSAAQGDSQARDAGQPRLCGRTKYTHSPEHALERGAMPGL